MQTHDAVFYSNTGMKAKKVKPEVHTHKAIDMQHGRPPASLLIPFPESDWKILGREGG